MSHSNLALCFIDAINRRDIDGILALCAPDHRFVDALGCVVPSDDLKGAWESYFRFMPVYRIVADHILVDGDQVAIFGKAWGGLNGLGTSDRCWDRPCAWHMRVAHDRVSLWQVYVDTKAVFDLL